MSTAKFNKKRDKGNKPDRERPPSRPCNSDEEEAIVKGAQQEGQLDELKKNAEEEKNLLFADDKNYIHYDSDEGSIINPNEP